MQQLKPFLPAILILIFFLVFQIQRGTPWKTIAWRTALLLLVLGLMLWAMYGR